MGVERAGKVAGSRLSILSGEGARLERALAQFMLDVHTREHGYIEVLAPVLVNSASMTGTANLPKFGDDAFKVEGQDLWLIPTSEVPLTNLHRDEILDADQLPLKYTAYTPCFRSEAGAAGKDTRGFIRLHQFSKVEMVKVTSAEQSMEEFERLTADAEDILQRLGLHYQVMVMCTGDMGFAQYKKYDLNAWCPEGWPSPVDGDSLENCYRCKPILGSNPSPSANRAHCHARLLGSARGSSVTDDAAFAGCANLATNPLCNCAGLGSSQRLAVR